MRLENQFCQSYLFGINANSLKSIANHKSTIIALLPYIIKSIKLVALDSARSLLSPPLSQLLHH